MLSIVLGATPGTVLHGGRVLAVTARAHDHQPFPRSRRNQRLPPAGLVESGPASSLVTQMAAHFKSGIARIKQQVLHGLLQVGNIPHDPKRLGTRLHSKL